MCATWPKKMFEAIQHVQHDIENTLFLLLGSKRIDLILKFASMMYFVVFARRSNWKLLLINLCGFNKCSVFIFRSWLFINQKYKYMIKLILAHHLSRYALDVVLTKAKLFYVHRLSARFVYLTVSFSSRKQYIFVFCRRQRINNDICLWCYVARQGVRRLNDLVQKII